MIWFAQFNKQITTENLDYLNLDYLGYHKKKTFPIIVCNLIMTALGHIFSH